MFVLGAQLDAMCIIEASSINACERNGSFRLNSNVSFDGAKVAPAWVTSAEINLFDQTIQEAKAGVLRPSWFYVPASNRRIWAWIASQACDGGPDTKIWGDRGCGSVYYSGRLTGLAMLGFHPLGTESGTWLTQILGEILNPDGNAYFRNPVCAGTGLYTRLTKINDSIPWDPRFESRDDQDWAWPLDPRVPGYHTDNDLIANGVQLTCNNSHYISCHDLPDYSCDPGPPLIHSACPATNSGHVGVDNCLITYTAQKHSGSQVVTHISFVWLLSVFISSFFL
jgi:hypothetical protein